MNIAIFVHYLPPHVGGIEVVADTQATCLAAGGDRVTVVTSAWGARPGLTGSDSYSVRRIRTWNYFEEHWGAVFPIYAPSIIWHGYKAVKNADIVHVHDAFYLTSLVAALWARILHKPLILTQHVDLVPHPNSFVRAAQRLIYATTGRFILRSSRQVIVLNSRVSEFICSKGIDRSLIRFLPNGIDSRKFSPPSAERKLQLRRERALPLDKVLCLFVGRFVPKKGFEKLLRLATIHNAELIFVGGIAPAGHTRSDQHFLGVISRDRMPDVYRLCDIFVLPSESEGFPLTVQEAMACGLCVIMTDDPAYDMYQLDRALVGLVDPRAESIGVALERAASDSDLRHAMAAYSREYAVKNFELSDRIRELREIYQSHVQRR